MSREDVLAHFALDESANILRHYLLALIGEPEAWTWEDHFWFIGVALQKKASPDA